MAAIAITIAALVAHAHSGSAQLALKQDALDTYTGSIRAELVTITPPATEMQSVPPSASDPKLATALGKKGAAWQKTFDDAATKAQAVAAPASVTAINGLFVQSIQALSTAASTYALVPNVPPAERTKLLTNASAQFQRANQLWQSAVQLLDQARADAKMPASALRTPASGPPNATAPALQTLPASPAPGGAGGTGGKGSKATGSGSKSTAHGGHGKSSKGGGH